MNATTTQCSWCDEQATVSQTLPSGFTHRACDEHRDNFEDYVAELEAPATTFTCTIDMSNAAFNDNPEELSQLLRQIAKYIDFGAYTDGKEVRDSNGNTVGSWSIR